MSELEMDAPMPDHPQAAVTELAKRGVELASYASYAEIVMMLGVNQVPIRKLSDRIFALNHELERMLDSAGAPIFDSEGRMVERIERYEAVQETSGQSETEKVLHETAKALKEAKAEIERLRNAADNIAPYLIYTIGDESPGHHPTMPSAVGAFLHSFDIGTAEQRLARNRAKIGSRTPTV